ncbi:hypothetical protein HMPREF1195_01504 [Streptococcus parasanguinis CC87K]|uniref:RNA-binding protein KhpB N-terminal domain-containing protein n=1 Tax=Streptococcus parasanguinis CC87K TaxID=1073372 RepID=V8BAS6_STRPA|nr:DUF4839 domain-containing protein [Streptococcus parasanguinis]ETD11915.1 hypothetical protein HMPREF1195_01504 [Streptococcus parasanguinis CC87K]
MGIYKGKNIEEAIKKGLKDLNVKKEDATIEVLEEGSGGIFGLFSKEAEVSITPLSSEEIRKRDQLKKLQLIGSIAGAILLIVITGLLIIFGPKDDTSKSAKQATPSSKIMKQTTDPTSSSIKTESSSSESSKTSSSETRSSSSSASSSSSTPSILTAKNNTEFATILQTEDPDKINEFVNKYKGQVVEFDGHIADIAKSEGRNTYNDILIYSGDYKGPNEAVPSPNFKLDEVRPAVDPEFKSFNGNNIIEGENIHIKARLSGYNIGQEILHLGLIEISPR